MTVRLAALVALAAASSACPTLEVVCRPGTVRCGQGCVDIDADERHCGACGLACGAKQVCLAAALPDGGPTGACRCRDEAALCGGACAVLASDVANCGACGTACRESQRCQEGRCVDGCSAGRTECALGCVDVSTDSSHCGACGNSCGAGARCQGGLCRHEVVAACFSTGQVVGLSLQSLARGPLLPVGTGPQALGLLDDTVLVADGLEARLYQVVPGGPGLVTASRANRTGASPNQVLRDGPLVYVVASVSGTLQVLRAEPGQAGPDVVELDAGPAGVPLRTVGELSFGDNSFPQGVARVGDELWVPLYGGAGAAADAGQRVARVAVAPDGGLTLLAREFDLKALPLASFDGGPALARPWAIRAHQGAAYVPLNNLAPDYSVAGPGFLARLTPEGTVEAWSLGEACLNPQWLDVVDGALVVSCMGRVRYDSSFRALSVEGEGLALVALDGGVQARWEPTCPPGASCRVMVPGRFATRQRQVLLSDQNSGQLFVLAVEGGLLVERRGSATDGGPVLVCPPSPLSGLANVTDVVALP